MQAALGSATAPAWLSPGLALIAAAYSPWGSLRELVYADPSSRRLRRFLRSSILSPCWRQVLTMWFAARLQPSLLPASSPLVFNEPLWNNVFLPVDQDYTAKTTKWHTRYTRAMANVGLVQTQQVQAIMMPEGTADASTLAQAQRLVTEVHARCRSSGIHIYSRPSKKWLTHIAVTVQTFYCRTPDVGLTAPWLLQLGDKTTSLLAASTVLARRWPRAPPSPSLLKTRHLGVPDDFYDDPKHVSTAASLRVAHGVLPKYADLVYKIVLRAVAVRSHMIFLDPHDQKCSFCSETETYQHLFVDCTFTRDTWSVWEVPLAKVGISLPSTIAAFVFDTPEAGCPMYQTAFNGVWPVQRACVWWHIWRERNNRTFRPDLPNTRPWTVSLRAVQLHDDLRRLL
ncbi:hypothetical protein ACHHYP_11133 [Achlya hypogyna]|uniref:Reverse transcriptase zinc-binding domain-containing protein n=1 Tax=Achlya hypogyna TaxID=1202772 RepID=A0A1V9YJQ7_ACHHY|nr:hypothetical protein ACHHYP_11133 [Achlya hypogyna]